VFFFFFFLKGIKIDLFSMEELDLAKEGFSF